MKISHMRVWLATALLALALPALAQTPATSSGGESARQTVKPRTLSTANAPRLGDFDQMLERRVIRVYVPYSRSLYFVDKGRERGISVELIRDFERWINQKYARQLQKRPLTVYVIPATRDRLLPGLRDGLADIAIGNLTVTGERLKLVDFFAPEDLRQVSEVLVTGPASQPNATLDELAGKRVHVRKASSYYESLVLLNERFRKAGKPAVNLVVVPDALEDEDMMEMLATGLLEAIVVDDWKAAMWAQVLPKLNIHNDIVLRENARTGWAIRKNSPQLNAELMEFYEKWAKKQGVIPYRQKQYMKQIKQLKDPTGSAEFKRFQEMLVLFEKYGKQYGFDPLMLAAQGYQESQLNQSAKSAVGAVGVMQLMPATGASLKVGDIRVTESNIHAGAKYMDQLMTKYFPNAKFDEANRPLFAFASYNCGPGNVAKMRKEAEKRGLDPDKWFNNVEIVTAEKIGIETTTYVRNIYKYYVSYRLTLDIQEQSEKARQQLAPAAK